MADCLSPSDRWRGKQWCEAPERTTVESIINSIWIHADGQKLPAGHSCWSQIQVDVSKEWIAMKRETNRLKPTEDGSFSIYEQPKWERIVASTQGSFRVRIWVRIRVWIRVRVGLYFGCSYIEKGPRRRMHTRCCTGRSPINRPMVGNYRLLNNRYRQSAFFNIDSPLIVNTLLRC